MISHPYAVKERKPDRRIERTRKLLSDALIALILEGEYEAITVQQITDYANLSRATFYLHYRDKDELLVETLEHLYDDIAPEMEALSPVDFTWNGAPPSLIVFQHVAENRDLYRAMFKTQAGWKLVNEIQSYLANRIRIPLERTVRSKKPAVSLEILSQYMAAALHGLVIWWLTNDIDINPEAMAQQYHALILPTLREMLG